MGAHGMKDGLRRRQAFQLAAQLPQEREDALLVLDLVRVLVEAHFTPQRPFLGECEVVPLRTAGDISPNLRAKSTDKPAGSP
jgi:hypothetical protein